MKINLILAMVLSIAASSAAFAQSAVNPDLPEPGSDVAADIGNINIAIRSCAMLAAPLNAKVGEFWCNTNVSPRVIYRWSGASWQFYATFDPVKGEATIQR